MILKMVNKIQDYPWGSRRYLQDMLGLDSNRPLAELWMGVHPRGMSLVETSRDTQVKLSEYISSDSEKILGPEINGKYGNLPYLFKLLAAGDPLSIQAHPSKGQAEKGFALENKKGIPLDAFNRNYKDDNHKPEIICAVTEYWAMKGFRSPSEILFNFKPWCPEKIQSLLFSDPPADESSFLKTFFITLMNLPAEQKDSMLKSALDWCQGQKDDAPRWVLKLNEKYPGDQGILSPLYLNTLCLKPGDALYLPAGELHAYLHGFGVELMANSDNVLRGGLTGKYIDIAELEKNLRFESADSKPIRPDIQDDGTGVYKTPSREFELVTLDCRESLTLGRNYPVSILVVTEGELTLREDDLSVVLKKGESCFMTAGSVVRTILGQGQAFIARTPA